MAEFKKMKKGLNLFGVYALATGATLSGGFFLLPGLAYAEAGPSIILCYILATLPLIPSLLSQVELGTAMPRSGGLYYFLDRSLGPLVGTVGGIGIWIALVFKTAFALIGMGSYIYLYLPHDMNLPIDPILLLAIFFAVVFSVANLLGAEKASSLQIILVAFLLAILLWFTGTGLPQVQAANFGNFFAGGLESLIGTSGLVYMSYIGLTKVVSVSEEVKDPERNLPLGIFLALGTSLIFYVLGTIVMVGVISPEQLSGDQTPVATAAGIIAGNWGTAIVTLAALSAFFAVANAGILSASRYPLAMGRDHLLPDFFRRMNKANMPVNGILITLALVIFILIFFDATKIAKLASAFQLLLFAMINVAVIVMRESGLNSYDPGYRSPFYPWMQYFGICISILLILAMGIEPIAFSTALIGIGVFWYFYYARSRIIRHGAIYHVFERMGRARYEGLDTELRGILKEKGLRANDPYDELVIHGQMLDVKGKKSFREITRMASKLLAENLNESEDNLTRGFLEGTGVGATPVSHGAALPHLRVNEIDHGHIVLVRVDEGIHIELEGPFKDHSSANEPVFAIFFLVSPEKDPAQHLRVLAQLASRIDDEDFMDKWRGAKDDKDLKEVLLRDERYASVQVQSSGPTADLIGKQLRETRFPEGCLVAIIRRGEESIIPQGNTVLNQGDLLTIIGEPAGIKEVYQMFIAKKSEDSMG